MQYTVIDDMDKNHLEQLGYQNNPTSGFWHRADYAGIAYSDGEDTETQLLRIVSSSADVTLFSDELQRQCHDWPSVYHLSGSRANVLRPFSARIPGASVLEIGAGCGAITRFLGEAGAAQVIALEGTPRRASICRQRTRDLQNVTVVCDRFQAFSPEQRFDIITLIGVLEYASLFTSDLQPARAMLAQISQLLNPGGTLIIAIENKFGLKYFAGSPEDHIGAVSFGIESQYTSTSVRTYGSDEIRRLIGDTGFQTIEQYAAFPDYKFPTAIISEQGFSCPEFDAAALAAQSEVADPQKPGSPSFCQAASWPGLADNGLGMALANSFILACRIPTSPPAAAPLAFAYSTRRRREFIKEIAFLKETTGITARHGWVSSDDEGAPSPNSPIEHIRSTHAPYVKAPLLANSLQSILVQHHHRIEDVYRFFADYLGALETLSGQSIRPGCMLPGNLYDAIPRNILALPDGSFQLIDQEWLLKRPLTVEFLLFRACLYGVSSCAVIRPGGAYELTHEQLLAGICSHVGFSIDAATATEFGRLELAIQREIAPNSAADPWTTLRQAKVGRPTVHERLSQLEQSQQASKAEQMALASENQYLRDLAAAIQASTSWRLTAPLRALLKTFSRRTSGKV